DGAEADNIAIPEQRRPRDPIAVDPGAIRGIQVGEHHPPLVMNQPGMPPADSLVMDMHGGRVSPADNGIEPQGKNDLQPGPSRSVGRDVENRLRRRTRLNRRHLSSGHRHPPIAVESSRPHLRKGWPARTQARPGAGECAWMTTASLRGPNAMKSYPRRGRPRPSGTEPASRSFARRRVADCPGGNAVAVAPAAAPLAAVRHSHSKACCPPAKWRRLALDGAPVHSRDTAEQTPL